MPLSADELIDKSRNQRKRKRHDEALVSALAAVESDPENSYAWWEVALCRIVLKDTRNAIIALENTVVISPDADGAWGKIGTLRLDNGDQDEAKVAFLEALDLNSKNTEALEWMSKVYSRQDNKTQDEEEASYGMSRVIGLSVCCF